MAFKKTCIISSIELDTPAGVMRAQAGASGVTALFFLRGDADDAPSQAAALNQNIEPAEPLLFCGGHDPLPASDDDILARMTEAISPGDSAARSHLLVLARQLDLYFRGKLREFSVPLDLSGTDFQLRVWRELCAIPYGATISYAQLALRTGNAKACRAVAQANHANPVAILIPCHRVIGSDGSLTGYAGGIAKKEFLLNLERIALLYAE